MPVMFGLLTILQVVDFPRSTRVSDGVPVGLVPLPTLVQLWPLLQYRAKRALEARPGAFGLFTSFHVLPFQASTSVLYLLIDPTSPTAVQLATLVHATPLRSLDGATLGLLMIFQVVPDSCSTSVFELSNAPASPTAVQFVALVQATLLKKLDSDAPSLGFFATDHFDPFQRSMSADATPRWPTAVQLRELGHEMDSRSLKLPSCGLETVDHCEPFQWRIRGPVLPPPTAVQLRELVHATWYRNPRGLETAPALVETPTASNPTVSSAARNLRTLYLQSPTLERVVEHTFCRCCEAGGISSLELVGVLGRAQVGMLARVGHARI